MLWLNIPCKIHNEKKVQRNIPHSTDYQFEFKTYLLLNCNNEKVLKTTMNWTTPNPSQSPIFAQRNISAVSKYNFTISVASMVMYSGMATRSIVLLSESLDINLYK